MAFKLCAILFGGMRLMIDKAASMGSRFGGAGAAAASSPWETISAIVGVGAAASVWRPRMPRLGLAATGVLAGSPRLGLLSSASGAQRSSRSGGIRCGCKNYSAVC